MKKPLAITLLIILTALLLTACGGDRSNSGITENDGKEMAKKAIDAAGVGTEEQRSQAKGFVDLLDADLSVWPADKLPVAIPEYPNGTFLVVTEGDTIAVNVQETDADTVKGYIGMLEADGWDVADISALGILVYDAAKDGWEVRVQQSTSTIVTILINKAEEPDELRQPDITVGPGEVIYDTEIVTITYKEKTMVNSNNMYIVCEVTNHTDNDIPIKCKEAAIEGVEIGGVSSPKLIPANSTKKYEIQVGKKVPEKAGYTLDTLKNLQLTIIGQKSGTTEELFNVAAIFNLNY
jgi:hypothetical protein